MKMKILHICNDFAGSKVHSNLIKHLEELGLQQTVYCPVRSKNLVGKNSFYSNSTDIIYSFCIRSWYKYVYHYKILKLYRDLVKKINCSHFNVVHATTLFSDGSLAYKIYKKYGTPYVVTVRSTDISRYINSHMYHTYSMGKKILMNSSKIYFISNACKIKFEKSAFAKSIWNMIKDRVEVRSNGIDDFWLDNILYNKNHILTPNNHNICFIGTFMNRKNLIRLIDAVAFLRKQEKYHTLKLQIIGGGNDNKSACANAIKSHSDFIDYHGIIKDKNKIMEIMRKCSVFALPSWNETFGLVYVEALTQNLPIVYTRNDGVDGFFENSVGISVDPYSVEEIANALKTILDNLDRFDNKSVDFELFNWNNISHKYCNDYKLICEYR